MSRRIVPAALAAALWSCALGVGGVASAATPLGPELQVNSHTLSHQNEPSLSMSSTGAFVVAWKSQGQDDPTEGSDGVFARRHDSAGSAVATEFQVNTYTDGDQRYPTVSINPAQRFVVVWQSEGQDGNESGVFAQLFNSSGAPQGSEFQVNSHTSGSQGAPDVAMGPGGGFLVVWQSDGQDGEQLGIFGRRHNDSGTPQASEFQINTFTAGHQRGPRVLIATPGELIVIWSSFQDGGSYGIFGRRVNSSGPQGEEFQINAYTTSAQFLPALAASDDGGFMVVWQSVHDGAPAGIFGRRFDSVGTPVTGEFQVNSHTLGTQTEADIAGNGTDFIAVWQSDAQDGDDDGVFARRLDDAGTVGAELQVNAFTSSGQRSPSVGMDEDGDFVVAWSSFLQDESADGTFARRFSLLDLATLDVDGDGETDALTDGLLVLRFLFGFTGNALTGGAVDLTDCKRCNAAAIEPYLAGLDLVLDVDGDDALEPLTDGLLVLRFLFGFTGATLTNGAVDLDDCELCDAAEIEPYLQSLI